jgi:GMP synthase-like glutamine amidotransferase
VRVLHVEHPDGRGPGVFGDGAERLHWVAFRDPPPEDEVDAIVLYGAETDVVDAPRLDWLRREQVWLRERLDAGTPILGVCFGAQLLADALGAEVTRSEPPEVGFHPVTLTAAGRADPVLGALPERFLAAQWHNWRFSLPPGATALGASDVCLQAYRRGNVWGVQFHPEVDAPTLEGWIAGGRRSHRASPRGPSSSPAGTSWAGGCSRRFSTLREGPRPDEADDEPRADRPRPLAEGDQFDDHPEDGQSQGAEHQCRGERPQRGVPRAAALALHRAHSASSGSIGDLAVRPTPTSSAPSLMSSAASSTTSPASSTIDLPLRSGRFTGSAEAYR